LVRSEESKEQGLKPRRLLLKEFPEGQAPVPARLYSETFRANTGVRPYGTPGIQKMQAVSPWLCNVSNRSNRS